MGTLAAGVAHEVNNPIAFVISNVDYALSELKPGGAPANGEELVEALEDAKQGAVRVAAIVRDLKLLARQDAPTEVAVDLRTLVESACRFTAHETRHRAKVIQELDDVPLTLADETRLGQVFINLIVNAAHAIPAGHAAANKITVRTRQLGDRIIAEVEDTGSGIPAHVLPRIFDPFFTTKPVGVGTGLGLSISHSIIVGLGGTLSVKSEPGRGTVFTVGLPIRAPEPKPEPASTGLQSSARLRILIVDDERLIGAALRRTLGAQHDVDSCVDASEALALIRTRKPYDVVLCDLMMPNMTGMDFHAVVRREVPKLAAKFVFMTGGACTEEAEAFIKKTEAAVLSKPFQPAQLFGVLPKQRGSAMH